MVIYLSSQIAITEKYSCTIAYLNETKYAPFPVLVSPTPLPVLPWSHFPRSPSCPGLTFPAPRPALSRPPPAHLRRLLGQTVGLVVHLPPEQLLRPPAALLRISQQQVFAQLAQTQPDATQVTQVTQVTGRSQTRVTRDTK